MDGTGDPITAPGRVVAGRVGVAVMVMPVIPRIRDGRRDDQRDDEGDQKAHLFPRFVALLDGIEWVRAGADRVWSVLDVAENG